MHLINNKSVIFLLVAVVIGVSGYLLFSGAWKPQQNELLAEDKSLFFSTKVSLSYDDFLLNLERECPYYEPNGAQYRECLINLLTEREQEVDQYQAYLVRDIHAITDARFQTARQTFITHLQELSDMWKPYRDQLCITTFDSMWGGSNQGGAMNTCRLYETEKYQLLLENFRDEWIR